MWINKVNRGIVPAFKAKIVPQLKAAMRTVVPAGATAGGAAHSESV